MKERRLGLICLILALALCVFAARRDHSGMASFVRQNQADLTALAEEALAQGYSGEIPASYPGIKGIDYFVYMEDGTFFRPFVQFDVGWGFACRGFYYSPSDIPIPFQGADATLTKNNTGWYWEAGGNYGFTEKITDCWYTFEAHL